MSPTNKQRENTTAKIASSARCAPTPAAEPASKIRKIKNQPVEIHKGLNKLQCLTKPA